MSTYTIDNSPVTSGMLTTSYVFSCKGRPFAALVSPKLLMPAATLLDYDLIRKLGLRMTDVQCRKFNFGGHKMRILGRVSSAVHCVQGGRISGSFHIILDCSGFNLRILTLCRLQTSPHIFINLFFDATPLTLCRLLPARSRNPFLQGVSSNWEAGRGPL